MKSPGHFNQLITINPATETTDGMGGFTESYAASAQNVWASVRTIKGQRLMDFQQLKRGIWYDIEIQRNANLTIYSGDTITFGSRTLEIHEAMNVDEADWTIRFVCYAKQSTV